MTTKIGFRIIALKFKLLAIKAEIYSLLTIGVAMAKAESGPSMRKKTQV